MDVESKRGNPFKSPINNTLMYLDAVDHLVPSLRFHDRLSSMFEYGTRGELHERIIIAGKIADIMMRSSATPVWISAM
jgi:hypothetical protein